MQHFADEILRRFPEVAPHVDDGDRELPYLMVDHVVSWLRTVSRPALDEDVVRRVIEFDRWCVAQPPGRSDAEDLPTVAVVGLREELFRHDALRPLIQRLMSRHEMLINRDDLVAWVGA